MSHQLRIEGWPGRVFLIAVVALTVAAGLCLFDDDGTGTDLCAGLAIVSVTAILSTLGVAHLLASGPRIVVSAVSLNRLDPPPKLFLLS